MLIRCAAVVVVILGLGLPAPSAQAKEKDAAGFDDVQLGRLMLDAHENSSRRKKRRKGIERGLRWLAAHQGPAGAWEIRSHHRICDGMRVSSDLEVEGYDAYNPGITGLVLYAFLGAGYGRGDHPYTELVQRGLDHLIGVQDPEGCFGARVTRYTFAHGLATLAMVEGYRATGVVRYHQAAQRGLDFLALMRNPYFAWRYGIKPGDNSTAATTFAALPLFAAKQVNEVHAAMGRKPPFVIDETAFDGIQAFLAKVTDPDYGKVGYETRGSGSSRPDNVRDRFPAERSEALTAAGMFMRTLMGDDPRKSGLLKKGDWLVSRLVPTWQPGDIDYIYWFLGSLALHQMGGKSWNTWSDAVEETILGNQDPGEDPCTVGGSWPPVGAWAQFAGRLASTAFAVLALEVSMLWTRPFEKPGRRVTRRIGMLTGAKVDAWRVVSATKLFGANASEPVLKVIRKLIAKKKTRALALDLVVDLGGGAQPLAGRLSGVLRKDKDAVLRAKAARALALLEPTEHTVGALTEALADPEALVRIAVAPAYARHTKDEKRARALLEKEARSSDEAVRAAATRALLSMRDSAWKWTEGDKFTFHLVDMQGMEVKEPGAAQGSARERRADIRFRAEVGGVEHGKRRVVLVAERVHISGRTRDERAKEWTAHHVRTLDFGNTLPAPWFDLCFDKAGQVVDADVINDPVGAVRAIPGRGRALAARLAEVFDVNDLAQRARSLLTQPMYAGPMDRPIPVSDTFVCHGSRFDGTGEAKAVEEVVEGRKLTRVDSALSYVPAGADGVKSLLLIGAEAVFGSASRGAAVQTGAAPPTAATSQVWFDPQTGQPTRMMRWDGLDARVEGSAKIRLAARTVVFRAQVRCYGKAEATWAPWTEPPPVQETFGESEK